MRIEHTIKVDFQRPGVRPVIRVAEGDASTRFIAANLYNGGEPFSVGSGVTGVVKYAKTDGHSGVYDTLDKGKASERDAVVFHDNSRQAVVELAPNICMGYGLVALIVQFVDSSGTNILSTFPVDVIVERDPTDGTEAEEYFSYKALDELYAAIDDAKADASAALAASMADISAEYREARVIRPSLTPAEYMMERPDGAYRISTDGGDDVFIGRAITIDGSSYLELSEFYGGDEYTRSIYVDGQRKLIVYINVQDSNAEVNPAALVADVSRLSTENATLSARVAELSGMVENLTVAADGKLYTMTVDSSAAYVKTVPANALPVAEIDGIGGMTRLVDGELVNGDVIRVVSVGAETKTVPAALRRVSGWGEGFSAVYYNSLQGKTFVRRFCTATLNGDAVASRSTASGVAYVNLNLPYPPMAGSPHAIDNYGDRMPGAASGTSGSVRFIGGMARRFDEAYTSVAEAKRQLNERPLVLLYELETAQNLDVSAIVPDDFDRIRVSGGGSIVFEQADGTVHTVPSVVTYAVKIGD